MEVPQIKQNRQTVEIHCAECKEPFMVEVPPCDIINRVMVTLVVWPDPDLVICPKCGHAMQFVLRAIGDLTFDWSPVMMKQKSNIVIPPPGTRIS